MSALAAAALAGCAGAGHSLPPAPSAASSSLNQLGAIPRLPNLAVPRRPSFIDTVPKQPSTVGSLAPGRATSTVTQHPAFFAGENALSNGVYYLQLPNSNIFGYYSYLPDPRYIYHFDLGYEYVIDANDGAGGLYLYDFASGHWWYSGRTYPFPYLYDFTLNAFLYYFPDSKVAQHYTASPRYFYNFTASQIVTIPSAMPAPAVGFLGPASNGSVAGILNNVTSGVTFVGISGARVTGGPSTSVASADIAVNFGATVLSSQRAPRAAAAAHGPHAVPELSVSNAENFRALKRTLQRTTSTNPPPALRRASSLGTTVGSTNTFFVLGGGLGSIGGSSTQRPATLRAVTPHGAIWIDNSLTSVNGSASTIQAIADDFENAWASDTAHYGTTAYSTTSPGLAGYRLATCDATGTRDGGSVPYFITPTDGKTVVFVVDVAGLGTGVGGYFSPQNYFYQSALNCLIGHPGYTASNVPRSNEAPMIVVGYYTPNPAWYETGEDLVRGMAHELQHDINFVHHAIRNDGSYEDTWIDEGMAMLAQDFAVNRMYPSVPFDVADAGWRAQQFLDAPQNFSLTAFTGQSGSTQTYNCSACYGAEYLFQRYMYDRFGGDAYLQKMLGLTLSYDNLQQASGVDPTQAISDFAVALAASGTGATTDPRFGFAALNLRATYNDQFGYPTAYAGPATTPLAGGTSSHMLGSFFYLDAGSSAAGNTVSARTASDLTGTFGLRGAVVQH